MGWLLINSLSCPCQQWTSGQRVVFPPRLQASSLQPKAACEHLSSFSYCSVIFGPRQVWIVVKKFDFWLTGLALMTGGLVEQKMVQKIQRGQCVWCEVRVSV